MPASLDAERELYEALKSMAESYDLVIQCWPQGPAKDSFIGFFAGTREQAEQAVVRFEVLKMRETQGHIHDNIRFDASAGFDARS